MAKRLVGAVCCDCGCGMIYFAKPKRTVRAAAVRCPACTGTPPHRLKTDPSSDRLAIALRLTLIEGQLTQALESRESENEPCLADSCRLVIKALGDLSAQITSRGGSGPKEAS